jgi:DNA-binding MarR family transcriptional regulator
MAMDAKISRLAETLVRILNKYVENQKRPRRYGLEELLYPAEIHMIMLIGNNPNTGVTELAKKAGITKGAVSQIAKKLGIKGLIKKKKHPDNARMAILELANKGKVAYYYHEKLHDDIDKELYTYLAGLSPAKLKALESFFVLFEKGIDKRSET